jgi:hypothetical protein
VLIRKLEIWVHRRIIGNRHWNAPAVKQNRLIRTTAARYRVFPIRRVRKLAATPLTVDDDGLREVRALRS